MKRNHTFGIPIPKEVAESRRLGKDNGNTLWRDYICKEMKEVHIDLEDYNDEAENSRVSRIYTIILYLTSRWAIISDTRHIY